LTRITDNSLYTVGTWQNEALAELANFLYTYARFTSVAGSC